MVDGLGFSVAPSLQKKFVERKTSTATRPQPRGFERTGEVEFDSQRFSVRPAEQERFIERKKKPQSFFAPTPKPKIPPETQKIITGVRTSTTGFFEQNNKVFFEKEGKIFSAPKSPYPWLTGTTAGFEVDPKFESGQEFSLRFAHMFVGRRVADWWLGELRKEGKTKTADFLSQPAPDWAVGIVSELPTFAALSPFLRTGVTKKGTAKTKQVVKQVKKPKIKITAETVESVKAATKTQTFSKKFSDFEKLIQSLRGSTPAQRKTALKLFKEVYGERDLAKLVTEYQRVWGIPKPPTTAPKTTIEIDISEIINAPQIPLVRETGTLASGLSKPLIVGGEGGEKAKSIFTPSKTSDTFTDSSFLVGTTLFTGLGLASQSSLAQVSKQANIFDRTTAPRPRLKPRVDTKLFPRMAQPPKTKTIQLPSFARPSGRGVPSFLRPRGKSVRKPFFFFGLGDAQPPIAMKKQQGYFAQSRIRGKWRNLSKNPMTRAGAMDRGSRAIDNTTAASFRIRKSTKKGKLARGSGYWGDNRHKFRQGKNRIFIERKTFRIDTPGEKSGLGLAKWLKSTKKKRGGKKQWLV